MLMFCTNTQTDIRTHDIGVEPHTYVHDLSVYSKLCSLLSGEMISIHLSVYILYIPVHTYSTLAVA